MTIWMKPSGEKFISLQKSLPKSEKVKQVISVSFTNLMGEGRRKGGREGVRRENRERIQTKE